MLNSSLDAIGVHCDLTVIGNVSDSLSLVVFAPGNVCSLARFVRVAIFGHCHVCLVPIPSPEVPATPASTVVVFSQGAVDELLGAHDSLVVSGNDPAGLGGLSGGKSPA